MELIRLKVNSQYRPCVDEAPYFSWVITSSKKNVMQTSYHITVTGPGEVVWDSGVVESDKSTFVEYNGKPLKSLSDYNWTCLLYTSPSPRDRQKSRMPSSA